MIRPRCLRLPMTAAAATAVALCVAGPASAHIHTDPSAVPAGAESTVGFIIEHGCEASPTTKMEIQLPDGASRISGVDANGFTAAVTGQVVTFTGGEVADGTEAAFQVTFTAPDEAGEVPVKIIQSCAEGVNEWIEVAAQGEAEPESPAPLLTITAAAASPEAEDGHDEEAAEHHDDAAEHDEAETTSTTVAIAPVVDTEADTGGEDDDSSSAPLVIGGIAALVVLGAGGAFYARSRAARTDG